MAASLVLSRRRRLFADARCIENQEQRSRRLGVVCAVGNSATLFPRIACERKIYSRSFCAPGADKCFIVGYMPLGIDTK
jgi:hypothetical protein